MFKNSQIWTEIPRKLQSEAKNNQIDKKIIKSTPVNKINQRNPKELTGVGVERRWSTDK